MYQMIKKYNLKNIKHVNDIQVYLQYPEYNFVYNKLWLSSIQNINSAPMGIYPNNYPIIFKPIINLFGMSKGVKVIKNDKEYDLNMKDGFFWMDYISGDHYCIDMIIVNGNIKFNSCLKSFSYINGSFKYHESLPNFKIPIKVSKWIKYYLNDYTGVLNLELLNGIIIDVHLRLNGDFQLYDKKFIISLDNFFKYKKWDLNYNIKKKFLIPFFVNKDITKNDIKLLKLHLENLCKDNKYVNSIMYENVNSEYQSEYASRLFMIDVNDLNEGLKIKQLLSYSNFII